MSLQIEPTLKCPECDTMVYIMLQGSCTKCRITSLEAQLATAQAERLKACEEVEALRQRMTEVQEIAADTLGSDDFQPQFSQEQHMTGPALRGNIERIACAARKTTS